VKVAQANGRGVVEAQMQSQSTVRGSSARAAGGQVLGEQRRRPLQAVALAIAGLGLVVGVFLLVHKVTRRRRRMAAGEIEIVSAAGAMALNPAASSNML
jgi:hypothetical protein